MTPLSQANLRARLESSRQELLDLGLRNSLLNYRCLRAKGVEIIDEKPPEIYRLLVVEGKAFTFLPIDEDQELYAPPAENTDQSGYIAERHRDTKLQTSLTTNQLHNRLLATYYAANTYIEEQGVNVLFLALGMLQWCESDNSDKPYRSPLLLIPVELERSNARERFHLSHTEEEIGGNISLAAKIKADFGLKYPEFPDLDGLDIKAYFDSISDCVQSKSNWVVERDTIVLGFFSFGKYLMFRDLDPKTWPENKCPTDNPIMISLLDDDGFRSAKSPYGEGEPVESYLNTRDIFHIMDADSTQALALLDAADGRNMVIQGPPGTGKSQTIANLIAEAVGRGQKILFVAEKMAALSVVKKRLDAAGLGDACLELHSNKTNKKNVLAEIRRTLELSKPRSLQAEAELEFLAQTQDRLNSYCNAVNGPIGGSGISPVDAFGHLIRLARTLQSVEIPPISLPGLAEWSKAEYAKRSTLVREMEAFLKSRGIPSKNPFWGTQRTVFLPSEKPRLQSSIRRALDALKILSTRRDTLASYIQISPPVNVPSLESDLISCRQICEVPCPNGVKFDSSRWLTEFELLDNTLKAGRAYNSIHKRYDNSLFPESWNSAASQAQKNILPYRQKWWRWISGQYRRQRDEVTKLCRTDPPRSISEILELLSGIQEHQALSDQIQRQDSLLKELFGPLWKGLASDWPLLCSICEWMQGFRRDSDAGILSDWIAKVLTVGTDRERLKKISEELAYALAEYTSALKDLGQFLQLDQIAVQCYLQQYSLEAINQILSNWLNTLDELSDMCAFNLRCKSFRDEKLEALIPMASSWESAPGFLATLFDRLWFEALTERAFSERPELAQFEGIAHTQLVGRFRQLDLLQLHFNRARLALSHWSQLPTSSSEGQMGVLRHEFEKKRRNMPLRKLISNAGNAIQAIKPVFMMSPLSIANYLPPESLKFDLVVFDEASQVKPVDAWGAILRGKQAVVVGDSKQLPPSNFFDTLSADEDIDEENRTADLESILDLFSARGAHQRMLKWHYRSRHESLIAVSNKEFYDSRLVVFPSPQSGCESLGLIYHQLPDTSYDRGRTRTNPLEALRVAEAVMQHARAQVKLPVDQRQTLGVAAFSIAQTEAVLDHLEKLRRQDPSCEEFFHYHQFEPFFVKNLENVQGDERDVIFISIGYGRTAEGFLAMHFGPLNRNGGERRLNVLITRARLRCEVFTNLTADDIDLDRTDSVGVKCLKTFLAYAQKGYLDIPIATDREPESPFESQVSQAISSLGHTIHAQVGCAGFFIDLAVVDPRQPGRYVLGIECDGATYHRARSARDRDRLRQAVLEGLGWRIHRIWSTDWYRHPERELKRVVESIESAMINQSESKDTGCVGSACDPSTPHYESNDTEPANLEAKTAVRREEQDNSNKQTIRKYEIASLCLDLRGEPLHEVDPWRLGKWAVQVLNVESPVHVSEVMRRIANAAGIARIGSRINQAFLTAFRSAVRDGDVRQSGDFLWQKDMTAPPLRDRSDLPPAVKKLELIAPEEIELAIECVVRESYGMAEAQVPQASCGLLGFGRVTEDMSGIVNRRVQAMLHMGRLIRQGTQILIPDTPRP
jgi:very-short-patch-repair endonuclease